MSGQANRANSRGGAPADNARANDLIHVRRNLYARLPLFCLLHRGHNIAYSEVQERRIVDPATRRTLGSLDVFGLGAMMNNRTRSSLASSAAVALCLTLAPIS